MAFDTHLDIDLDLLSALVKTKRGTRTFRAAATEANVAPATIMRAENRETIDLSRFARLCKWLEVEADKLFVHKIKDIKTDDETLAFASSIPDKTPEDIEVRLRKDGVLTSNQIDGVVALIRGAYQVKRSSNDIKA